MFKPVQTAYMLSPHYMVVDLRSRGYVGQNCWGIMFSYRDQNDESYFEAHRGHRTGELVTFSRKSDARRLVDALNRSLTDCAEGCA